MMKFAKWESPSLYTPLPRRRLWDSLPVTKIFPRSMLNRPGYLPCSPVWRFIFFYHGSRKTLKYWTTGNCSRSSFLAIHLNVRTQSLPPPPYRTPRHFALGYVSLHLLPPNVFTLSPLLTAPTQIFLHDALGHHRETQLPFNVYRLVTPVQDFLVLL